MGFRVVAVDVARNDPEFLEGNGRELLNIYAPTAMLQELRWTRRILDRDDTVREDDVIPLLLELGPDRYIDLHTRANGAIGVPVQTHLHRRRIKYALNREAFFCDVAVLTLGLIETWWDLQTGQTIEFHPQMLRHPDRDRFAFRRLRYEEAYTAIEQSVSLILQEPARRILMTTSPVPLAQTFTQDDVIVANTYSKSMLRAVAGAIVECSDRVDYFPSYESVMLSKRNEVWTNDLVHIEPAFVGQIMSRVVLHYVDDNASAASYGALGKFTELVQHGQMQGAKVYYERIRDQVGGLAELPRCLVLAEYEAAAGMIDASRSHVAAVLESNESQAALTYMDYFRCARVFKMLGENDRVDPLFHRALECMATNPSAIDTALSELRRLNWETEVDWLIRQAERLYPDTYFVLSYLAHRRREGGDLDEYHRLKRAALMIGDESHAVQRYSLELEESGDVSGAIDVLLRYDERVSHSVIFRRLTRLLHRRRQHEDALRVIDRRLERMPDDPTALGFCAIVFNACGRADEALEYAERAVALGCDLPGVAPLLHRLRNRKGGVPRS
jgi:hypothetical protein